MTSLLFHTFWFSSSWKICEQCPRQPLSLFSSFPSLHSIDQTDPPWWHNHMPCCFPSNLISFSDHAVRLAGWQAGWRDSEGGLDGCGSWNLDKTRADNRDSTCQCLWVHVNLYSSLPTMSRCYLVPFTPFSLWRIYRRYLGSSKGLYKTHPNRLG